MKFVGKPYAGKPHVRFEEGGKALRLSLLYKEAALFGFLASNIGEV
jgi:hypothetical protein